MQSTVQLFWDSTFPIVCKERRQFIERIREQKRGNSYTCCADPDSSTSAVKIVTTDDNSLQKSAAIALTCTSILPRGEVSTRPATKEKNICHYKTRSNRLLTSNSSTSPSKTPPMSQCRLPSP